MSSGAITPLQRALFSVGAALTVPIFIVDLARTTNKTHARDVDEYLPIIGLSVLKTGVYCVSLALFPKTTILAGFGYVVLYGGVDSDWGGRRLDLLDRLGLPDNSGESASKISEQNDQMK